MSKDNNSKSSSSSSSKNSKSSSKNSKSSSKKKVPRAPKQKGIPIDIPSNNQKKDKAKKVKKAKKTAKKAIYEKSYPHDHVPYALYIRPTHEQSDNLTSPFFLKPKGYNLQRGRLGLEW